MPRPSQHPLATPIAIALLGALWLSGAACTSEGSAGSDGAEGERAAAAEAALDTVADSAEPAPAARVPVTDLPPNELGEVLVLEYHRLGEEEGPWVRSPENFRADLRRLQERGFRPVTMRQLVSGDFDLPPGATPVVFTIDDSSRGQFYLREDGSIDPGSMMGMWEAFREENPDWDGGAVWCILPGADHPSNFFGARPSREMPRAEREADIRRKMEILVERGHEPCNHTMWHARLDQYDDAFVQEQIGSGEDSIRAYLPEGYEIVTFSLPFGIWPKNRQLAWQGSYRDGKRYRYEAVLEVTGGPSPSPFSRRFDPRSINRFIVGPGALERRLRQYEEDPSLRFVSDGDPATVAFPRGREDDLARDRLGDRRPAPHDPESR
jgi:hypothetical protein